MAGKLTEYRRKRNFTRTAEPRGELKGARGARRPSACFVVQKHDASHLHYDFRLEIGGVMKSWSVPKGPSLDPSVKRLAVEVEDHPVEYNRFEGTIPEGEYGGGTVMLWDRGELLPHGPDGEALDLEAAYRKGRIDFTLKGERLAGSFVLVRKPPRGRETKPQWLLIKRTDEHAAPGSDITASETTSVTTGRSMEEIAGVPKVKEAPKRPAKRAAAKKAPPEASPPKPAPTKKVSAPGAPLLEQLERIEREGGDGELVFEDGASLAVSSLDKVFFPELGVTKGALMRYYVRVAPALLPLIADRPLGLRRFPNGVGGPSFFQHEPKNWPASVRTAKVRIEDGTVHPRLVGGDLPTLLYTLQLGALSVHPWLARVGSLAVADYIVLDLDPSAGASYDRVVDVAQAVREALRAEGLEGHPKTSGASGLHVMVPMVKRTTWKAAAALAERIARATTELLPGATTLERSLAKRPEAAVYVDHLQNARGKTVVSAWSVRARKEATVSTPLDWGEVARGLDPRAFTMDEALRRIASLQRDVAR